MSNRRYIELYSGNRDRTRFPDMAYFEVELNRTNGNFCAPGGSIGLTALDPVGLGFPDRTFFLNSLVNGYNISSPTGPYPATSADPTSATWCGKPYYSEYSTKNPNPQSGVIESGPVSATGPIIFPPIIQNCQPTTLDTTLTYYNGYGMENCQTGVFNPASNEFRIIQSFTSSTATFTTDLPFTLQFTGSTGPTNYAIYDPSIYLDDTTTYNTGSLPQMHIQYKDAYGRTASSLQGEYNGYYIYNHTTNTYQTISDYDPLLRLISYDNSFNLINTFTNDIGSSYLGLDMTSYSPAFSIRKVLPAEFGNTLTLVPGTVNQFTTTSTAPNGSFVGSFIYIIPQPDDPILSTVSTLNYVDKLSAYAFQIKDWTNGVITILGSVNLADYANGTLDGRAYEVILYTKDNYSSLNYSGSMVSQNESVCYEIELISLILPNVTLKTGSRIAFYPYVFVEFTNVSAPVNSGKNIIYSNNPNALHAMFICPINDTTNPLISSFTKIDSAGMTQTVKFKPNDSLRLRIYLPNGDLFEPVEQDTQPPLPPVPRLQLQAVFSVKRI